MESPGLKNFLTEEMMISGKSTLQGVCAQGPKPSLLPESPGTAPGLAKCISGSRGQGTRHLVAGPVSLNQAARRLHL